MHNVHDMSNNVYAFDAELLSPPWAANYDGGLDLAPAQLDALPSAFGG